MHHRGTESTEAEREFIQHQHGVNLQRRQLNDRFDGAGGEFGAEVAWFDEGLAEGVFSQVEFDAVDRDSFFPERKIDGGEAVITDDLANRLAFLVGEHGNSGEDQNFDLGQIIGALGVAADCRSRPTALPQLPVFSQETASRGGLAISPEQRRIDLSKDFLRPRHAERWACGIRKHHRR